MEPRSTDADIPKGLIRLWKAGETPLSEDWTPTREDMTPPFTDQTHPWEN